MRYGDVCDSCAEGDHETCEEPERTWQTGETGSYEIDECCCGVVGGPPDPDRLNDEARERELLR